MSESKYKRTRRETDEAVRWCALTTVGRGVVDSHLTAERHAMDRVVHYRDARIKNLEDTLKDLVSAVYAYGHFEEEGEWEAVEKAKTLVFGKSDPVSPKA